MSQNSPLVSSSVHSVKCSLLCSLCATAASQGGCGLSCRTSTFGLSSLVRRVCQGLAVWRPYGVFGCDTSKPENLSKRLPKGAKAKHTDSALPVTSSWHQDGYVVSNNPAEVRMMKTGSASELRLSNVADNWSSPVSNKSDLMNREYLSSKDYFFSQSHFFLAALRWISAQIQLQTPMSKERWRGYGSRAEPKQWPLELRGMKISIKKAYLPVKTSTPGEIWKDRAGGNFKTPVVPKELRPALKRSWILPPVSRRWQNTPCRGSPEWCTHSPISK